MAWNASTRNASGARGSCASFPNRAACLRLVPALCVAQSDEWVTGRRYLELAALGGEDTPGTLLGREEGAMALVG